MKQTLKEIDNLYKFEIDILDYNFDFIFAYPGCKHFADVWYEKMMENYGSGRGWRDIIRNYINNI